MAMGMIYINLTNDDKLFKQLNYFSPPIMLCFFVRSGMTFNLKSLANMTMIGYVPLIVVAVVYFFARIVGKYGGAYLGCEVTKKSKNVKRYLGLGLVPQAGVAIGLAYMGGRILGNEPGELGDSLQTIILASSVLYELVGPGLSKLGLYLSKSYTLDINEEIPVEEVTKDNKDLLPVEILTLQIKEIQNKYKNQENEIKNEAEEAFTEAAEEYYEEYYTPKNHRFINRR